MKKILYTFLTAIGIFGATSCSDMLDTESGRQLFDPSLGEKTDSMFYAYGILQSMQELADQYYFQNELRGDLVTTTGKATIDISNMAKFDADVTNKYDSVYLYYKVINNCNYYLKNRRQDLITGSTKVVMNEYIAVASIRAWAYMQLARNYGDVPYITTPVTSISEINASTAITPASQILASEAEYLQSLKDANESRYWDTPTYGTDKLDFGNTNWGQKKEVKISKCFMPINVVLGDLYLENGQYDKAAKSYYDYLYYAAIKNRQNINVNYADQINPVDAQLTGGFMYPSDYNEAENNAEFKASSSWSSTFDMSAEPGDVISYIPMAVSKSAGTVTKVPETFGYKFYESTSEKYSVYATTTSGKRCPETSEVQVVPTEDFVNIWKNAPYYYVQNKATTERFFKVTSANIGDGRFNKVSEGVAPYTSSIFVRKPSTGNIYLYRTTTVFLHLAEAMNRMGYPDAAFAVLKDGLNEGLKNFVDKKYDSQDFNSITAEVFPKENFYISSETLEMLSTVLPFVTETTVFETDAYNCGIHQHGAGYCRGLRSPYQYSTVVGDKLAELKSKFNLDVNDYTREDSINAMEDILCDEYALEFAFEGTRFADLQRIARHKNESGIYGGNFGDMWLADKLKAKGKDITTKNCHLPFK